MNLCPKLDLERSADLLICSYSRLDALKEQPRCAAGGPSRCCPVSRQNLAPLRTKPLTNSKQGERERERGRGSTALVRQEDCAKQGAYEVQRGRSGRKQARQRIGLMMRAARQAPRWRSTIAAGRRAISGNGGAQPPKVRSPLPSLPSSLYTSPQYSPTHLPSQSSPTAGDNDHNDQLRGKD